MTSAALATANCARTGAGVDCERTLDLAALAQLGRGDRVEVQRVADRTLALFERTLELVDANAAEADAGGNVTSLMSRFIPESEDLRRPFIFAEAVGSYNALNDLIQQYAPGYRISQSIAQQVEGRALTPAEVRALQEYRQQLSAALANAMQFIAGAEMRRMSAEDVVELNQLLQTARDRCECVTAVLGEHLIREVEAAVTRLAGYQEKIKSVRRTLDGVFLVDSELFFIPSEELIGCVNTIFAAAGNAYVSEHIDGTLLLAARNLLISTVSFYSYYGKQQIYTVFSRRDGPTNKRAIAHHIRAEIRRLFSACRAENKLVLKRVMSHAEREFEISVEAIREEAERSAIAEVTAFLPPEDAGPVEPTPKRGLLRRLIGRVIG